MAAPRCPDCRVVLKEGWIPDHCRHEERECHWSPGTPVTKRILGLPVGLKVDIAALAPIVAYRCPRCGLLRLFAHPPPKQD